MTLLPANAAGEAVGVLPPEPLCAGVDQNLFSNYVSLSPPREGDGLAHGALFHAEGLAPFL